MTQTRSESKSGEFKTLGRLVQAIKLPNGNFLCEHRNKSGLTYISIFDPIRNRTVAKEHNVTHIDLAEYSDNFLHPLTNDTFLYHRRHGCVFLLKVEGRYIRESMSTKNYYTRVVLGADNALIGLYEGIRNTTLATIDIETLQTRKSSPYNLESNTYWTTLPSGLFLQYPLQQPINQSKALLFRSPHDVTPIKELELKDKNISVKKGANALSNSVIAYYVDKDFYHFHNIVTNKTRQYPKLKPFIFADLGDNRILLSTGEEFFILDETDLEMTKIQLGFETTKSCTSISCSEGVIALTFSQSDSLFVTHVSELISKKVLVSTIMDSISCMPEPLAKIMEGYRGASLFNKEVKLDSDDKTKQITYKTLEKR